MPIKVQTTSASEQAGGPLYKKIPKWLLVGGGFFLFSIVVIAVLLFRYSALIGRTFWSGLKKTNSEVSAAPRVVRSGEAFSEPEVIAQLRRSGYGENVTHPQGRYKVRADGLEVWPGPNSYFTPEAVLIRFARGRVAEISLPGNHRVVDQGMLEPELISNLTDERRSRRRVVRYPEIPAALLQAVTSVEDKHFFQHTGFDVPRILKAAYVDMRERRKEQGASTLNMQLARNVFLDSEKTWRRKAGEALLTLLLEPMFSKGQRLQL